MIGVIDYNAGNIKSVTNALARCGADYIITNEHHQLLDANKVIFPGVGEASTTMQYLRDRRLDETILQLTQPVLGICLGMQLMCTGSEEGNTSCMDIFSAQVKRFPNIELVPHMGWNNLSTQKEGNPLLEGISNLDDVYFVHSYYVEDNPYSIATCDYIMPFCAAMQKNNYYATQFHPEKSADVGERILLNFLRL